MAFVTSSFCLRAPRNNLSQLSTRRSLRYTTRPTRIATLHMCSPTSTTSTTVESFIKSANDLGTVRFIAISGGAVLETIGRFDYSINTFNIPNKGEYVTIANLDKTFECHINTSKVGYITLTTEPAKMGGHELHVIRFKGPENNVVLSCLLMWDPSEGPGKYLHGAVEAFQKLKQTYGERVEVSTK